ncbi:MAG: SpoIIE family protein phosphatase, partial [Armatimonadota bacterium]
MSGYVSDAGLSSPPFMRLSALLRAALPVLTVAAATVVASVLQVVFHETWFTYVYLVPVGVVGYFGSRAQGLLTVLLAVVSAYYVTLPPTFSFEYSPEGVPAAVLFTLVGVATALGGNYIRRLEDRQAKLLAQEQAVRIEAEASRKRQELLVEAGTRLAYTLEYSKTLSNVARVAVPAIADWCAFDLTQEDGTLDRIVVMHANPDKRALADELRRYPPDPGLPGGAARVVGTGRSQFYPKVTDDMLVGTARDEEHLALLRRMDLVSVIMVPLVARGRTLGALTLASAESGRRYGDEDLAFAEELARRAALFVDNARLYDREHRIAITLQAAFLPISLPQLPGIQLHAAYLPGSTEAEVGGDWYDAFQLADGRIALSIGDVMGRGLRAAASMGLIRQTIRAGAHERDEAAAILARASRLLRLSGVDTMATALVGILDLASPTFTHASAGHPPPLLGTPGGPVTPLTSGGPPLGVGRSVVEPAESKIILPAGSLLVLYTDGLIEYGRNPLEGEARLADAIRAELTSASSDPAEAILQRVLGNSTRHDDVAILTVSVAPHPLKDLGLNLPAIPSSLPLVRQAVHQLATNLGLEPDRTAALQIAVGEAVNNVVEHAYGVTPGFIRIRAGQEANEVVVEVQDSGRWRRHRVDGGGRGLKIMRSLVDRVHIATT